MLKIVHIDKEFITLGQLLKKESIIGSGGQAKWFLKENNVSINGLETLSRGRKLYDKDLVNLPNFGKLEIRCSQG